MRSENSPVWIGINELVHHLFSQAYIDMLEREFPGDVPAEFRSEEGGDVGPMLAILPPLDAVPGEQHNVQLESEDEGDADDNAVSGEAAAKRAPHAKNDP